MISQPPTRTSSPEEERLVYYYSNCWGFLSGYAVNKRCFPVVIKLEREENFSKF